MVSTLAVSVLVRSLKFTPSGTGSVKLHKLAVPLEIRGSQVEKAIRFLTQAKGHRVRVVLRVADDPSGKLQAECTGLLRPGKLSIPTHEKDTLELPVTLEVEKSEPDGEILDLVVFLLGIARAEVVEVELGAVQLQEDLPFEAKPGAVTETIPLAAQLEKAAREIAEAGGRIVKGAQLDTAAGPVPVTDPRVARRAAAAEKAAPKVKPKKGRVAAAGESSAYHPHEAKGPKRVPPKA